MSGTHHSHHIHILQISHPANVGGDFINLSNANPNIWHRSAANHSETLNNRQTYLQLYNRIVLFKAPFKMWCKGFKYRLGRHVDHLDSGKENTFSGQLIGEEKNYFCTFF